MQNTTNTASSLPRYLESSPTSVAVAICVSVSRSMYTQMPRRVSYKRYQTPPVPHLRNKKLHKQPSDFLRRNTTHHIPRDAMNNYSVQSRPQNYQFKLINLPPSFLTEELQEGRRSVKVEFFFDNFISTGSSDYLTNQSLDSRNSPL